MRCNTAPRVPLALLDPSTTTILQSSFEQCCVDAIRLSVETDRLIAEEFEGCLLPLN